MTARRWTLVAVIFGSASVFLESSVTAIALPQIGRDLSSRWLGTLEGQSYVYYAYLLALSSLLILAGSLADHHGRRRMFLVGLIGFAATSALCGLAPNMELLVAARILQGASGAILVPGSLSIITASFSGEQQGRAFGIWAGASAGTTILGPVVGGILVTYVSWRAVFFITIPLIAVATWATIKHVPETRDEEASGRFDVPGAVIVALAVGGLTFGAIRGQAQEWSGVLPYISLAIGASAAIAFPFMMRKSESPTVPLDLFRSRNFTVANISTLLVYGAIYVVVQFVALFSVNVLGYTEVGYGIATIPMSIFLALFSARFGVLGDRYGPRIFMTLGPALMGLGLLWLTRIPAASRPWQADVSRPASLVPPSDYVTDFLPAMVLFGLGLMVMVAPLTATVMRSVPVRHSGVASAFNNAISRVGPQLGGALIFIAVSATFYSALAGEVPRLDVDAPAVREEISPLNPPATDSGRVRQAAANASTKSFHVAMAIAAAMCFAGAAVNGLGVANPEARREDTPVASGATS
jgi:EmrB/QacA subfamily drug resistance transporter